MTEGPVFLGLSAELSWANGRVIKAPESKSSLKVILPILLPLARAVS